MPTHPSLRPEGLEECGEGPVKVERVFGVFCETRKAMSRDWFAILSSFIHLTTIN